MQGAKQGTSSEAKGSQSGREKRRDESFQVRAKEPVLENFCRAFSPGPTDCPWASEDEQGSVNRQRSVPTLATRGFSRVRRKFSVLAEGRGHERRSAAHDYLSFRYKFTQASCKLIVPRS